MAPHRTTMTVLPGYELSGYSWIMYDLDVMPSSCLQRSNRETFEVIFRIDRPDGLIRFTGNERDNIHLALKVCNYNYKYWHA